MLLLAAGALGCGGETVEVSRRARLWTLLDLQALADADPQATVAAGPEFPDGLPVAAFLIDSIDPRTGMAREGRDLAASSGFIDGTAAVCMTAEVWSGFDEVWAQPLYTAMTADGALPDTAEVREPWVFGVGPGSRFYSPFWQVYGFQVPDGVDVETLRDTRAVIEAANRTGGFRQLEHRNVAAAPAGVFPHFQWTEQAYHDDVAAWDGQGDQRYIDFGAGRFQTDAGAVVAERPMFVFTKNGALLKDWPWVGGTRPLFAPGENAGAPAATPSVPRDPSFGGLWRLHTVELPGDAKLIDGRPALSGLCGTAETAPCELLDSQAAIEGAGAERIRRTGVLVNWPLLQLGDVTYPRQPKGPNPPPQGGM